ncbi:MAG: lipid A deacylase LpxR family protein [Rhizomicrobium sp.]|nr:lipid A deacylase LpxR family protein [Rhizomicrobium sp.]
MRAKHIAYLLATTLHFGAAQAADAPKPEKGTFGILFENDWFGKADHNYTNGVELTYTTAPQDTPDWLITTAHWLPFFSATGDVRTRYALGQTIFTPLDKTTANPSWSDRPYAGFLFGTFGLVGDSGTHLDQLQFTVGVIGPMSIAGETQNWVHGIIGDDKAKGWHYQLHNEPGLIVQYQRNIKLIPPTSLVGLVFDVEPNYGVAVGNVYDFASAGAMARLGFNLPTDYGPMRIDPSLPGSNFFEPNGGISAYIFAGADGRAMARNLFLDGNTFRSSRSVNKYNLVYDYDLGAAVTFRAMRLSYTYVIRSREFSSQTAMSKFGAVAVSFRF